MAPATNIGVFNLFVMVLVDYAVGLALGMLIHLLLPPIRIGGVLNPLRTTHWSRRLVPVPDPCLSMGNHLYGATDHSFEDVALHIPALRLVKPPVPHRLA